jgi:hypothetical protein
MPASYWASPSRPSGAADHIVDEHVPVSQPPPNVKDGPESTMTHWQVASAGLNVSISQGTSRQLAQGVLSGQVRTLNSLLTLAVEKFEWSCVPD